MSKRVLTTAEIFVLSKPPFGFCAGSNMWPLVHYPDENGGTICDGEVIDALLRDGLLLAEALDQPIFVENGGGDIPDNEMTHRLFLTDLGRAALATNPHEGG